jgi:ribosome biogenesis protein NSA1
MKIITGDETGLIKLVDTIKKSTFPYGTQSRQLGIQKMCWIIPNISFALARHNGLIEIWNISSKNELLKDRSFDLNLSNLIGISAMNETTLLCYSSTGTVAHLNLNDSDSEPILTTLRGPLETLECCYGHTRYATGGLDNDLQLYDLNSSSLETPIWSAKNVPHDNVRLAVPIFITSISFLKNQTEHDGNLIVTGTGHHHVRLYDIRTKRQPIRSWEPMEYKITNIQSYYARGSSPSYKAPTLSLISTTAASASTAAVPSATSVLPFTSNGSTPCCLITDCSGVVQSIDLLTGKLRASYTTSGGSVKDLALSNCEEYFTTVSYDRYVRVYEVNHSRERFHCYLKNRLTACLMINEEERGNGKKGKKKRGGGEEEEGENGADVVESYVDSDDEEDEGDEDSDDQDDDEESDDEESDDGEEVEDDESEEEEVPRAKKGDQKRQIQQMKPLKSNEKKPKYL